MSRTWLLTNTCYGTWLPGDSRGFVGYVRERRVGEAESTHRVIHHESGTIYDAASSGLEQAARQRLQGSPIHLNVEPAAILIEQFLETAKHLGWTILAAAVMFHHFHLVVTGGETPSAKLLGDLKSWGTRRLSQTFGAPSSGTWWTERGSKRHLPGDVAVMQAVDYVLFRQPQPLVTYSPWTGVVRGWLGIEAEAVVHRGLNS
jgi:REP element-mobilizing transposase RayT